MTAPVKMECLGCAEPLSRNGDGYLIDAHGDTCCEIRYPDCGACEDGESHPHWVAASLTSLAVRS